MAPTYKILKKLDCLEQSHPTFASKYLYSLVNSGNFNQAFNFSKKIEMDKNDSFESDLIMGVYYLNKSNYKVSGPFAADTIFLKNNRKKYNVIVGMYHDQVLTPIKTLFEYDAINITLGLPFFRISPDHGPNEKMIGKNKSSPLSLVSALDFLDFKK